MSDQLTSWLRTVVPALWSIGIAWLAAHTVLPADVLTALDGAGGQLLAAVVLAAVYALLRKLEPHMPRWLTVLLLGSNRQPAYAASKAEG